MRNLPGIYKITNTANNKIYVGSSSKCLQMRRAIHFATLNSNTHSNAHLQNSVNQYGLDKFIFEVIFICKPEECVKAEQYFIDQLKPDYNILQTAYSSLGYKHSEASKRKAAIALGKPIIAILPDLTTKEFLTLQDAGKFFGIKATQISRVCKGHRSHCHNIKFQYS
tara:strand:- start:4762 stop:5262 length:501 start_codon:yes stop_codon:yes gene_type:complete